MTKKLTPERIREILETHNWIKVRRYDDDPSLPVDERYRRLEEHHRKETEFLIGFIRDLVRED